MILNASCVMSSKKTDIIMDAYWNTIYRSGGSYTWNPFIYISLSQTLKVSLHMPSKNKILWPFDDQGKGDFLEAPRDLLHSLARASESWKAIVTSFLRVPLLVILLRKCKWTTIPTIQKIQFECFSSASWQETLFWDFYTCIIGGCFSQSFQV